VLASLRVNVSALVDQQPDDLCVTAPRCSLEGVAVPASSRVGVAASFKDILKCWQ
jgi:hypothetical protein